MRTYQSSRKSCVDMYMSINSYYKEFYYCKCLKRENVLWIANICFN